MMFVYLIIYYINDNLSMKQNTNEVSCDEQVAQMGYDSPFGI